MMTPHEKFKTTRTELSASLIERDNEIDLVLTALVAQEHVLLVGVPGTAKSMLADALVSWMHGKKFAIQINKFTDPSEVCGALDIPLLKVGRYRRVIDNMLPDCDLASLDELFKGSSAILNTMLQILNERKYRNDGVVINCPLKLCIGSSNEWPGSQEGGKELGALFDRFLFRTTVRSVGTDKGLSRLFWDADLTPKLSTTINSGELASANRDAQAITWTAEAKDSFSQIHKEAKREGIIPGDRRLRKAVKAAQAYAWLEGADEVQPDHLEILGAILWDDPQEQPKKLSQIIGQIANPVGLKINGLLLEAEQIVAGANLRELAQAASVTKKLQEIRKQLKGVAGPKAAMAHDHIEAKIKEIKMATIASM